MFFHLPHLNSPLQRHSQQLTTKQSGEERGGSQAVDQGREDGGATSRWQGNNIPFSSIDRDHNSCLSRDRLRKAIALGAVKHGCLGELKVKRKALFAEPLPLIQPTSPLFTAVIFLIQFRTLFFFFTGIFFFLFFRTALQRPRWNIFHIDDQTVNLPGLWNSTISKIASQHNDFTLAEAKSLLNADIWVAGIWVWWSRRGRGVAIHITGLLTWFNHPLTSLWLHIKCNLSREICIFFPRCFSTFYPLHLILPPKHSLFSCRHCLSPFLLILHPHPLVFACFRTLSHLTWTPTATSLCSRCVGAIESRPVEQLQLL